NSACVRTRMPLVLESLCPSKVKFTSSMPCRSAAVPKASSAPLAAPLYKMQSSGFIYSPDSLCRRQRRDRNAADAVLVDDFRDQSGSLYVLNELTKIFRGSIAPFRHTNTLLNYRKPAIEHSRTRLFRRNLDEDPL